MEYIYFFFFADKSKSNLLQFIIMLIYTSKKNKNIVISNHEYKYHYNFQWIYILVFFFFYNLVLFNNQRSNFLQSLIQTPPPPTYIYKLINSIYNLQFTQKKWLLNNNLKKLDLVKPKIKMLLLKIMLLDPF